MANELWKNSDRFLDASEHGALYVRVVVRHNPVGFRFYNPQGNYIGEIVEFEGQLSLKFESEAVGNVVHAPLAGVEVTGLTLRYERENRRDIKARVIFAGGEGFVGGVCYGWIH